ncbi:MAG: purine-nucleoside phosphorylase [Clostridia bacterium]|nr:purine-nucleoside phosphorylase [Clostridia bacterium]
MRNNVDEVVKAIKDKVKIEGPYTGIILGTCFSSYLDEVQDKVEIPFTELPELKTLGSDREENKFVFGTINGKKVIMILGRIHYSLGYDYCDIATPIFALKELGCEKLILCSSLGAISHKLRVGDIVTIDDHINLTGRNPLYNCDYDKYGHKFIDMSNAYDEQMIDTLIYTAKKEMAIKVKRGVLAEFPGPSAETVAECQFADQMGADVMGFNVCSEIIAAKYCKLPVVVYALVTNYVSAYTNNKIKHEDIVYNRKCASAYYLELLSRLVTNL